MNSGINLTLHKIYDELPLYAEEGGDFTVVDVTEWASRFTDAEQAEAASIILLVQRMFAVLGLLDEQCLQQNQWRFVSFPASLLARSVLKSLADVDQSLFESGFWNQNDSSSPVSDQQRNLLHTLETQRAQHHKTTATPVRYVHVAWGLIVVDGKVLLRHREDQHRENLNNYVLIGGRLSQNDLRQTGEHNALEALQSPLASENNQAIEIALKREITEETGLEVDTHYQFKSWRTIKPYTAVEGAGANHALTEYRIHVYQINLDLEGIFALAARCERDSNLTWFTLGELEKAKSVDGKMAFIDALIADYPSPQAWQLAVNALESSYQGSYSLDQDINAITLPSEPNQALLYGKTGQEQKVEVVFNEDELALLTSLCLYAKDPNSRLTTKEITPLPEGWLAINNEPIRLAFKQLSIKLHHAACPIIEGYKEHYYRIALAPELIYFDDALFCYSIDNKRKDHPAKTVLTLTRDKIESAFFAVEPTSLTQGLSPGLTSGLSKIAQRIDLEPATMETFNKGVRRDLGPLCRCIGLRRIVRTVSNTPIIALRSEVQGPNSA